MASTTAVSVRRNAGWVGRWIIEEEHGFSPVVGSVVFPGVVASVVEVRRWGAAMGHCISRPNSKWSYRSVR